MKSKISLSEQKFKDEGQRWVMDNIWTGVKWNPTLIKNRFGNPESVPITSGNPKIIKAYYYKKIDMTIIVNTYKNKVVTWRMGRKSK